MLLSPHTTVKLLHQSLLLFPSRWRRNIQQFICAALSAKTLCFTWAGYSQRGQQLFQTAMNQFTRALSFMLTDGSGAKPAKTSEPWVCLDNLLWDKRADINRCADAHCNTFFTSYKSYVLCTLEGLLTFNSSCIVLPDKGCILKTQSTARCACSPFLKSRKQWLS